MASFKVTVKGKIEDVLAKVKAEAAKNGVKFDGDANKGSFSGHGVEGAYTVKGQDITINVSKTPFFASDKMVEEKIRKFFAGL